MDLQPGVAGDSVLRRHARCSQDKIAVDGDPVVEAHVGIGDLFDRDPADVAHSGLDDQLAQASSGRTA
jgi:hypothetical protein